MRVPVRLVGGRRVAGRWCVSAAAARRQRRREDEREAQDRKGAVRARPVRDHHDTPLHRSRVRRRDSVGAVQSYLIAFWHTRRFACALTR